ncbi:MAG: lysophospholipid acyltransferase family protein [Ilumatobacteraceae bacterium]
MTSDHRSRLARLRRRLISITGLVVMAGLSTVLVPLSAPTLAIVDLARGRRRLPLARLNLFGVWWCWIEIIGVVSALALWITGRGRDADLHYRLMSWWAGALMWGMGTALGRRPRVEGLEHLSTGRAIVLSRHASLADSLLSAWSIATTARLHPRYVLKRELLWDPCLDIVGLRIPNHFLARAVDDNSAELESLRALATGLGERDVVVIFAEGTRANPAKRARALERIAERSPERAARMSALQHLLPPRPAGSVALVEADTDNDLISAWHVGFEGMDTFGGIISVLTEGVPAFRFVATRHDRSTVPDGAGFADWLDSRWLEMDAEVDGALRQGHDD